MQINYEFLTSSIVFKLDDKMPNFSELFVMPNESITIIVDYPFRDSFNLVIKGGKNGKTLKSVIKSIVKFYHEHSDEMYGHTIYDLFIDSIDKISKNKYTLSISS